MGTNTVSLSFFLMMMQNLFVSRHVILASMLLGVCLTTSYGPVEVRALYSLTRSGKGTFVDATIELKGEELILKLKGEAFSKKQTLTIPEHLKIVSNQGRNVSVGKTCSVISIVFVALQKNQQMGFPAQPMSNLSFASVDFSQALKA